MCVCEREREREREREKIMHGLSFYLASKVYDISLKCYVHEWHDGVGFTEVEHPITHEKSHENVTPKKCQALSSDFYHIDIETIPFAS